jgi:hypothetical protein
MSVTTVFRRFHADIYQRWLKDREEFDESSHPDCEPIQLGVELLAVAHGIRLKSHPNYCEEVDRDKEVRVGFEATRPRTAQGGSSCRPPRSPSCAASHP